MVTIYYVIMWGGERLYLRMKLGNYKRNLKAPRVGFFIPSTWMRKILFSDLVSTMCSMLVWWVY